MEMGPSRAMHYLVMAGMVVVCGLLGEVDAGYGEKTPAADGDGLHTDLEVVYAEQKGFKDLYRELEVAESVAHNKEGRWSEAYDAHEAAESANDKSSADKKMIYAESELRNAGKNVALLDEAIEELMAKKLEELKAKKEELKAAERVVVQEKSRKKAGHDAQYVDEAREKVEQLKKDIERRALELTPEKLKELMIVKKLLERAKKEVRVTRGAKLAAARASVKQLKEDQQRLLAEVLPVKLEDIITAQEAIQRAERLVQIRIRDYEVDKAAPISTAEQKKRAEKYVAEDRAKIAEAHARVNQLKKEKERLLTEVPPEANKGTLKKLFRRAKESFSHC